MEEIRKVIHFENGIEYKILITHVIARPLCLKNEILDVGRFALIKQNFLKRSSEIPFRISDDPYIL